LSHGSIDALQPRLSQAPHVETRLFPGQMSGMVQRLNRRGNVVATDLG
jgi:hypothetical protein